MRMLLTGCVIAVSIYILVLTLAYSFQRSLLYFPDQYMLNDVDLRDTGFEHIEIVSARYGDKTSSIFRKPKDASQPVIMHFHGNGNSIALRLPIYQSMAKNGAGVLAVGYPGYGGNSGAPSEQAFYDIAQSNYNALRKFGYQSDRIVIVGQSLGTGVATWLASKNDAAGLILEAAYTGMDDMASRQFPFLPAKLLVKDRYRNLDRIDNINMPLSWIHGMRDDLIPFSMGQKLFDAAKEPKTSHPVKNGGHNDLWQRGIDEIIRSDAERFVSMAGAKSD